MIRFPSSRLLQTLAAVALTVSAARTAEAQLINFDDLIGRNNFFDAGIASTYQGYNWGTSLFGIQSSATGWAYGSNQSIVGDDVAPVSAPTIAWTWNGTRSLFIDFLAPKNVQSAWFATLSPSFGSYNSRSVTMIGYDALGNVLATSSTLNLTNTMQQLNANFVSVNAVEFRSDRDGSWFTTDDIDVSAMSTVPEPSSVALMASGLLAVAITARRRRKV